MFGVLRTFEDAFLGMSHLTARPAPNRTRTEFDPIGVCQAVSVCTNRIGVCASGIGADPEASQLVFGLVLSSLPLVLGGGEHVVENRTCNIYLPRYTGST